MIGEQFDSNDPAHILALYRPLNWENGFPTLSGRAVSVISRYFVDSGLTLCAGYASFDGSWSVQHVRDCRDAVRNALSSFDAISGPYIYDGRYIAQGVGVWGTSETISSRQIKKAVDLLLAELGIQ